MANRVDSRTRQTATSGCVAEERRDERKRPMLLSSMSRLVSNMKYGSPPLVPWPLIRTKAFITEHEDPLPGNPRGKPVPCSPFQNISHISVLPRRIEAQDCLGIL